jgi:hypothetical protein
MCKHVAAVLYGVGARLDHQPELLFRLRGVDATELVTQAETGLSLPKQAPASGRVLQVDDISALFGLDMAAAGLAAKEPHPATAKQGRTRTAPSAPAAATSAAVPTPTTPKRKARTSSATPAATRARTKTTSSARRDTAGPTRKVAGESAAGVSSAPNTPPKSGTRGAKGQNRQPVGARTGAEDSPSRKKNGAAAIRASPPSASRTRTGTAAAAKTTTTKTMGVAREKQKPVRWW